MGKIFFAGLEEGRKLIDGLESCIFPITTTIDLAAILEADASAFFDLFGNTLAITSGEHTACERVVADDADVVSLAEGKKLILDHAEQDIVARLDADKMSEAEGFAGPIGISELPGGKIGAANIANFAGVDKGV